MVLRTVFDTPPWKAFVCLPIRTKLLVVAFVLLMAPIAATQLLVERAEELLERLLAFIGWTIARLVGGIDYARVCCLKLCRQIPGLAEAADAFDRELVKFERAGTIEEIRARRSRE